MAGPAGGRGGGRGLFAGRALRAGEVAAEELPLLAWPSEAFAGVCCARCLRLCEGGTAAACPRGCGSAVFCSEACWQAAHTDPLCHSEGVCQGLRQLRESGATTEERDAARFILLAYGAKVYSPEAFSKLWSLVPAGHHCQQIRVEALAELVTAILGHTAQASAEEVAALLARDGANGFAIMGPRREDGERQMRGSAIYPGLAMANHECLPNMVRFDDFDTPATWPVNMRLELRTIQAMPAGEELLLGYFPLDWGLEERRKRLRDCYDFICTCSRCQLEASWEAEEEDAGPPAAAGGVTEDYLSVFFLKHVCPVEDCGGSMAPLDGDDGCVCNCCGHRRSDAEFLASLNE